ncbi:phage tail protein [Paraflavitalea soli]|uniref:Phage tail protein n=1 Tax=Paraflavitalea soli TaxID=2315862 RepID=A0A3B7MPY4_9BACT|nr:tail fiber protein [Paraflavitalea soli]AXY75046.1 phage tail protein [Paraflavitalea soli]
MEGVLAYVTAFAGNFAPRGWALCQGQIMAISQNTALFSLLGTTYGGNGQTTFALPDLRGRTVVGAGQGPGLSQYSLGELAGSETTTMTVATMPSHGHTATIKIVPGANTTADATTPANGVYASPAAGEQLFGPGGSVNMKPYPGTLTTGLNAGGPIPFSTLHPVLALNYLICLQGVFPARN